MATGTNAQGWTSSPATELFASKLRPPRARVGLVSRRALVDRLDAAADVPITSLAAPAGYGKTTVLAEWAHRDPAHFAWLSIDRSDNDLSTLLSYITAALDRIEPLAPDLLRPTTESHSVSAAASRVASAISGMREPIVLVLDHMEALENQECLDTVAELALHFPTGSRLALATRVEPPLPMPRLRVSGDVLDVGVDELAMTATEARTLLRGAGVDVDDAALDQVIERAEGWPVGLHLAALALKAGCSSETAGVPFSGDDRLVADYLRAEILAHLSDDEVTFLTRTAVLDRMTGSLCDTVLGATGSDRVLESLSHSNLLLVPLDRQGEWYRYHNLFHDLLRAELRRREPWLVAELHLRAAEWCEANRQPETAIDHAQAGRDPERVNRLLMTIAGPIASAGRWETFRNWLAWLEAEGVAQEYPAVATLAATCFAASGLITETERWVAYAEDPILPGGTSAAARAAPDRLLPDHSTFGAWQALLRAMLCRDGADAMRRDAQAALAQLGPASGYRPAAFLMQGIALALTGSLDEADRSLAQAFDAASTGDSTLSAMAALGERALIAEARKDWSQVGAFITQARSSMRGWGFNDFSDSGLMYAVAARFAIESGHADAAQEHLTHAARLRPNQTYVLPHVAVQTLIELARVYVALNDTAGARAVLRQAREVLLQRPNLGALPAQVAELESSLGTMDAEHVGASSLTAAELRLVPFLPTHLTFPQIGERLCLSRNTVKSQAIAIYQRLGVSSRSDAVDQLRQVGLLDA